MTSSPAILCRGLKKRYPGGVTAVDGLDLEVRRGECFGLLGPNGAGKTTTIEILEGLLDPTEGEVSVLGMTHAKDSRELRAKLGISLQETVLSEKLTVRETLVLFRSFYDRGLEPDHAISLVELGEKSDARVGKLSGGQKQRLAVATAMIGDPELIFLDEPTTGLDPHSRRSLWEVLARLRAQGRTILLTTHAMDEAERLCNRVAIVDRGKVIALGTPEELIASIGGDHVLEVGLDASANCPAASDFERLPAIRSVRQGDGSFVFATASPHAAVPQVLTLISEIGGKVTQFRMRHASLEDVFVNLTGRQLRDADVPAA